MNKVYISVLSSVFGAVSRCCTLSFLVLFTKSFTKGCLAKFRIEILIFTKSINDNISM